MDNTRELECLMVWIEMSHQGMSEPFEREVEYHLYDVEREYAYHLWEAVDDAYESLCLAEYPSPDDRKAINAYRDAEIVLGVVVPKSFMDETYLDWIQRSVYRRKGVTYYQA